MAPRISDIAGLSGEMGKDAEIRGGDENESTPAEQREPTPVKGVKLDKGPKVGEAGEYRPAMYRSSRGNIRQDR